jgi:hypothetical protein
VLQCFEGPSPQLKALLSSTSKAVLPYSSDGLFYVIVGGDGLKKVRSKAFSTRKSGSITQIEILFECCSQQLLIFAM